ncbi:prepilin-type N-terminal cleavage/methylation domain-containing protein [Oceanobacillus sp. 143]|uniref:Prepilin-type cleavage/methylation domain-containing protein n=1 Tax=Oceanobacillus zhaokaii TaxID=2052660 RepID=A0A345PMD9_9BACI|nr:prepilin-type cleavage/methylation domain-containing protein [Oceanobacillus zhaokaii]QGS69926.1 prepilin-type N-terminal cleavage/methylation domain-containing protein [Oceanobacillus sp. 143]
MLQRLKKDERGLTLVELLAVVVILAIVGAIAFVAIGNVMENSRQDAHVANAQQIVSAAKLAEASGTEIGTDFNVNPGTDGTGGLETLDTLVDPWTKGEYDTATVSSIDGNYSVTLSSSDDNTECAITASTEAELLEGRETACQ